MTSLRSKLGDRPKPYLGLSRMFAGHGTPVVCAAKAGYCARAGTTPVLLPGYLLLFIEAFIRIDREVIVKRRS